LNIGLRKEMTRTKTQSTQSSEKQKNNFSLRLGVLARDNFLKRFCQTFQSAESKA
jgi:hypothetical protein